MKGGNGHYGVAELLSQRCVSIFYLYKGSRYGDWIGRLGGGAHRRTSISILLRCNGGPKRDQGARLAKGGKDTSRGTNFGFGRL